MVSSRLKSRDALQSQSAGTAGPRIFRSRTNVPSGDYLRRFFEVRDDLDFGRDFVALDDFAFVLPLRDWPEDFVRVFPARELPDDFLADVDLRVNFGIRLDVLTTRRTARFAR